MSPGVERGRPFGVCLFFKVCGVERGRPFGLCLFARVSQCTLPLTSLVLSACHEGFLPTRRTPGDEPT